MNISTLAALVLAVGVALGGWFVGEGFRDGRASDRYVTVKGVSERDVVADLALWPMEFTVTGDSLAQVQGTLERDYQKVLAFLTARGLPEDSVRLDRLKVNDLTANPYRSGPIRQRFIVSQRLMVRTNDPKLVHSASQDVGELLKAGVVLAGEHYDAAPKYIFTKLNEHKPAMIAEATARARIAAEEFARDSGSRVGAIRYARQGIFVVRPRDNAGGVAESAVVEKTLRVVSSVDYLLED